MRCFLLAVVAISSSVASAATMNDVVGLAKDQNHIVTTIAAALDAKAVSCEYVRSFGVYDGLRNLQDRTIDVERALVDHRSGDGARYAAERTLPELAGIVTETQFQLAGALLRRGCLDDADTIYRGMQAAYAAPWFNAVRQRAVIGVDDVRVARATISRPAPPAG
jgi:hypothetical protein